MKEPPLRPGTLVRSLAGRDMGVCYVVLAQTDRRFVAVTDGATRPVDRPKIKNLKHLLPTGTVDEVIRQRLERGERVTDGDIQQAIRLLSHAN